MSKNKKNEASEDVNLELDDVGLTGPEALELSLLMKDANHIEDESLDMTPEEQAALEARMQEAQDDLGDGSEQVEIEELEFIEADQVIGILESIFFATDKPLSLHAIKQAFQGTNIKTEQIRRGLSALAVEYAGGRRGVTLEEVSGGYQLRTKVDNMTYLRRMVKARPFKLSGPALEVLSIVAYKQPTVKAEIDQIRGVESGHLLRALMEKGLVNFAGKSDLPGKPMQYATTRKFLEIFGLRNLKELPSLSEIDELLPDGIGETEEKKTTLDQLTGELSQTVEAASYSVGEEELGKIADELQKIDTTTQFFEEEKRREKERRDAERAQNIREAVTVGEAVDAKELKWLEKYERELAAKADKEQPATDNVIALPAEGDSAAIAETISDEITDADEPDDFEFAAVDIEEDEHEPSSQV